jgi:competence protein ComEA
MSKNEAEKSDDDDNFEITAEKETLLAKFKSFNFQSFLNDNKTPVFLALFGLILAGLGMFLFRNTDLLQKDKIEVIGEPTVSQSVPSEIIVEIAGSVEKPGVYKLKNNSRIEELLVSSGGLSAGADRDWVEKYVNRAAKLTDGQKIYIKSVLDSVDNAQVKQTTSDSAKNEEGYQNVSPVLGVENSGLTNINSATFAELDKLPGIGQVYGQKIIEQRPYSNIEELISRQIIPKTTYEKIKGKITVY